jgi:8-amino-7-oxononanoate synthase
MTALLERRKQQHSFRQLKLSQGIDFSSNDYLGLSRSPTLLAQQHQYTAQLSQHGATGSRLLNGHHALMQEVETTLAQFHQAPSALLFNSGYDANLALFGNLFSHQDLILADELIHASIHDGLRLGKAQSLFFRHNDLEHLETLLAQTPCQGQRCIALEAVYSMDGDLCPLAEILALAERYEALVILDEAHSTGVLGTKGQGLACALGLESRIFARLHTFGKAIGGHGAAVLSQPLLRDYLINFARPLIYSTAPPLSSIAWISLAYAHLAEEGKNLLAQLWAGIRQLEQGLSQLFQPTQFKAGQSPIAVLLIGGNEATRQAAQTLQNQGFDVRAVLSPTVPLGQERLRICLHAYNSPEEIQALLQALAQLPLGK